MKLYLFIILLLCDIAVISQVERTKAPAPDYPKTFELGKLTQINLENGLKLFLVKRKGYGKYVLSVNVGYIPKEKQERPEYIDIINEAYDYKTYESYKYSRDYAEKIFEKTGTQKGVSYTGGFMRGLKKHLHKVLPIYSELVINPKITPKHIKLAQKDYNESLNKKEKSKDEEFSRDDIVDSLVYCKYKNTQEKKVEKNFKGINIKDVINYQRQVRGAVNANILLYGDFSDEEAKNLISKYFGKWNSGIKINSEIENTKGKSLINKREIYVIDNPNATQSLINFNWNLFDAYTYDENHIGLNVLNSILGGSQMSYLFSNVREDKGLTYSINSSISGNNKGGRGGVWTRVTQGKEELAIESILYELIRLRNTKVSDEDLEIAKNSVMGSFAKSITGVSTVPFISFVMVKDMYNLPDNYLANKNKQIQEVDNKYIYDLANKYIDPYKCLIIVEGNVYDIKGKLEKFGKVTYLDSKGKELK